MRKWLTKDFWWKLFSVFLAVVVWITIHKYRQESYQPGAGGVENIYGDLPIHIVSASADVRDYRVAPATVSVTVSGSKNVMGILQANQIHAFVDLTDLAPDSKDSRRTVQVTTPMGVTLVSVEPSRVGIILPPKKQ